ncbi:Major surface antigen 4 precursor [Anaplasma phagocytophilum]|nr:Major surface antigen 4 precursor [Anaplasma phagocytophilum]SBO31948.1 Major surface antigen 4 precursor [Anaplasma phagocytophilum]
MELSNTGIDGKICKVGGTQKYDLTNVDGGSALCNVGTSGGSGPIQLKDFRTGVLEKGKGWPGSGKASAASDDNAKAVAEDLIKLPHDEKIKVAGLLAKTIEGGEVVEIRAVSSTSVMVNACYDLLSEGLGVVPYACVGLGGNFVGVVDGHITPKLAYRLKAGLSYQLSPEISAFAGGFYHRVVGDGVYDDLPAQRLVDDTSPAGRTKDTAIANFSMAYVGGEFGVRFAF